MSLFFFSSEINTRLFYGLKNCQSAEDSSSSLFPFVPWAKGGNRAIDDGNYSSSPLYFPPTFPTIAKPSAHPFYHLFPFTSLLLHTQLSAFIVQSRSFRAFEDPCPRRTTTRKEQWQAFTEVEESLSVTKRERRTEKTRGCSRHEGEHVRKIDREKFGRERERETGEDNVAFCTKTCI